MKTMNFFKSIIIMMVALVAMSANAQELVNGIDTRNAKACGEYLVNNPKDTLVSESTFSIEGVDYVVYHKVFLNGGRLVQGHNVLGQRRDTVKIGVIHSVRNRVISVTRNDSIYTVVSKVTAANEVKTDTTKWREYKSSKEVPFEDKVQKLAGQKRAESKDHKDLNGNSRHHLYASLLGGVMITSDYTSPVGTVALGYETCHFLFDLGASVSSAEYTRVAEYSGRYVSFSAQFSAGWKFWQDRNFRHYLAIKGMVGYGYQKTDGVEAFARSKNYSPEWGAYFSGGFALSSHWLLRADAGVKLVPEVLHDHEQTLSKYGVFVNLGAAYRF